MSKKYFVVHSDILLSTWLDVCDVPFKDDVCLPLMVFLLFFQTIDPVSFVESPIIFGDFIKMGAEPADKIYEELSNLDKLKSVLQDVSVNSPSVN